MRRILMPFCVSVFLFALFTVDVSAQVSRLKGTASRKRSVAEGGDAPVLAIDKIYGIGNRAKFDTPTYSTSAPRGVNTPRKWSRIEVKYKTGRTKDDWLDSLTFSYYALAKRVDREKKTFFTFYRKNIRYVNIEAGKRPLNHRSHVFLRPAEVRRNGELIAVAVEISYNGEIVDTAVEYASGAAKLLASEKGKWWTNSAITESQVTTTDTSSLLDRSESPWAYINIDDYEVIK
jgi:hypothetical protein